MSIGPHKFLILEDNPMDSELNSQWLREGGIEFNATLVDSRKGFENALKECSYDLILADYSLPEFDGISALEMVRARDAKLPFIFVSGVLGEDVAVDTMLKGATDYVLKSKLHRLVPAVQRALSEHQEFRRRQDAEAELRFTQAQALEGASRQALLLRLLQEQRVSTDSDGLMLAASRHVADFLKIARAGFCEVHDDGSLHFICQWTSAGPSLENLPAGLDEGRAERYRQGDTVAVADITILAGGSRRELEKAGIHAFVCSPVLRAGDWKAAFFVIHAEPRLWTDQDTRFIREVAELTWDSVERARAVAAREASEQRLRTAAETANLGSWELDLSSGKMICSDQCKRNYGWPLHKDFNYPDLRASIHPEDAGAMADAVEDALTHNQTYRAEYRNIWPDGTTHWVIASGRAQYDENGTPRRMSGFTLDVTERHRSQAALIQSEKLAAVGRLASTIAHEINNPLESVTNLLYLARHSKDQLVIQEYLELADQELRRVAAITSQTLRFHRQSSSAKWVHDKDLVESVLAVYDRRLKNAEITLGVRLRAQRPVKCLDGEIRQVLNNLVGNAIDAMRPGGALAIRSRDGMYKSVEGLWFTIADNGSGMSIETVKRLFDAFYTTKGIGGTGLGLWISKEIITRHEGVLRFRSRQHPPAQGTIFSLFLPCTNRKTQQRNG